MEYGIFKCPKCGYNKMSGYSFWASRMLIKGLKQWLFYNKIKKKCIWKCWSLLSLCDVKTRIWYDPCGCCFNPCSIRDKEKCTLYFQALMKIIFVIILHFFLFLIYLIFFFWFDVFYCLCYRKKYYSILSEKGELKISHF